MLNAEHVLIPYQVSDLPPGPWVVFAPHADDETFGMGGALLLAKQQGIETHVVVMTDGSLGGEAENLVNLRQRELYRAADLLGLDGLHQWLEPDRRLEACKDLSARARTVIEELSAAAVFFPGPLEIHPDHRATGLIVWEALRCGQQARQRPRAYSYEIGAQNPINCLLDITPVQVALQEAMAVYVSQNSENNYPELVLALDKCRTFSLDAAVEFAEGFYEYSEEDLQWPLPQVTHRIIDRYF